MTSALITGGASGLGAAITRCLAGSGCYEKVWFTFFRSKKEAAAITEQFPFAEGIRCNFSDRASVEQLLERIASLDFSLLVNNAIASMQSKHFHLTEPDDFVTSFTENVVPTLRITQQAIKSFRKKKTGRIISILTAYLVNRPPIGLSQYVANKAFLLAASKSWAEENARFGITANCVSPSMMQTGLTRDVDDRQIEEAIEANPFGRLVTPEEVASTVLFLATSNAQINSTNILINGGLNVV